MWHACAPRVDTMNTTQTLQQKPQPRLPKDFRLRICCDHPLFNCRVFDLHREGGVECRAKGMRCQTGSKTKRCLGGKSNSIKSSTNKRQKQDRSGVDYCVFFPQNPQCIVSKKYLAINLHTVVHLKASNKRPYASPPPFLPPSPFSIPKNSKKLVVFLFLGGLFGFFVDVGFTEDCRAF